MDSSYLQCIPLGVVDDELDRGDYGVRQYAEGTPRRVAFLRLVTILVLWSDEVYPERYS